jgi:hypothetical protein
MARPRKQNVKRTPSGRVSRACEGIHPETLAIREKQLRQDGIILAFETFEGQRLVPKRTADDRLSGYTLGRLYLRHQQDKGNPGSISQDQFEAGEAWASLVVSRKTLDDSHRLGPKSPSFSLVGGGRSLIDMDPERVARIKSRWGTCDQALTEASAHHGWKLRQVLFGVCVENWPIEQISETDFGLLRTGLNALHRALR